MFENKYPIFKKGNIIEKKDLELLRDNTMELVNLLYSEYEDGIIKGFNLYINENKKSVVISQGILKFNGQIFWMNKKYEFMMPEIEDKYILKIKLLKEIKNRRYYIRSGEFKLERGWEIEDNELEITRFITRIGANLRNDYANFADLKRDFNLLEIINTKYASKHKNGTLHKKILELYSEDVLKKEKLDSVDINFCINCSQELVERQTIIKYINYKLGLEKNDYNNEELYEKLLCILNKIGEKKEIIFQKRIVPKKITID